MVKRPPQQPAQPPIRQLLGAADAQTHIPPHPAQPRHTNDGAPRTRKRHQQEHRPQRPTERSDPTQHAKGRMGDCPGPRKDTATRRTVTRGGGGGPACVWALDGGDVGRGDGGSRLCIDSAVLIFAKVAGLCIALWVCFCDTFGAFRKGTFPHHRPDARRRATRLCWGLSVLVQRVYNQNAQHNVGTIVSPFCCPPPPPTATEPWSPGSLWVAGTGPVIRALKGRGGAEHRAPTGSPVRQPSLLPQPRGCKRVPGTAPLGLGLGGQGLPAHRNTL